MTETYFPFQSGAGAQVLESQWSMMARNWVPTGVIKGALKELAVTAAGTAMSVSVDTGRAFIMGCQYQNDASKAVQIAAADATNPRIDVIALRIDWSANTIGIVYLEGTAATSPLAPALTQNDILSGGTRWEIALAQVAVAANATAISSSDVTDERVLVAPANGVEVLTRDDVNTRSYVLAHQTTPQSFSADTSSQVTFDSVVTDNLGEFSNNTFTASRTGLYEVTSSMAFAPNTGGAYRYLLSAHVNGSEPVGGRLEDITLQGYPQNNASALRGTTLLKLNEGDQLTIGNYVTAAVSTITTGTYFTIVQIA